MALNSDPAPAQALRAKLARMRAAGATFTAAWPAAVDCSLAHVARSERPQWESVCAQLRPAWEAAYERRPVGACGNLSLLLDHAAA